MNNTVLTICLSAAIFTAVATQGFAAGEHGGKTGPHHSFEDLDANADGLISPEEMQAHRAARFAETDTNGDGVLSKDEVSARAEAKQSARRDRMINRMFSKRDTNGDGHLTLAEMAGGRTDRLFAKADTNKDGLISEQEFDHLAEKRRSKHGETE